MPGAKCSSHSNCGMWSRANGSAGNGSALLSFCCALLLLSTFTRKPVIAGGVKKWGAVAVGVPPIKGNTLCQRERERTGEPTRSCKSCGKVFDFMIYLWASSAAPLGNKLFANLLKPSAPCRATSSSPTPTIRFFSYSFKVPAKRIKLLMPSRLKSKANMHTIRFV